MTRVATWIEHARNTFWVLPALGILVAVIAGLGLPRLEQDVELPGWIAFTGTADTARSTLQLIATVAVSVAGISFSVIVVALVLASQQLSPRVLSSFQRRPLNQVVLGMFLSTAAFSLYVLSAVENDGRRDVPELSVTLAMLMAAVSLALFVVFLHHMVRSLNAGAVIRQIAADGHRATDRPYPAGAGGEPDDLAEAERVAQELTGRCPPHEIRAPRAGYIASVEAAEIVRAAERADAFVEQVAAIGRFAVTGAPLALAWCPGGEREALIQRVTDAFVLNEERSVDHDVAFPLRQLTDVALKGLSSGVNDPTTAENAMDSVADTLVRVATSPSPGSLRMSESDGVPRMRVRVTDFDALVRIGFDQVRRDGVRRPSFAVRLLELLHDIRDTGGETAESCEEIPRQAGLTREAAIEHAEVEEDRALIEETYRRLHGSSELPGGVRAALT